MKPPQVDTKSLTFDSMDRTLKSDHFTVMLFVFQFYPVYNFGIFIDFGLRSLRSERINDHSQGEMVTAVKVQFWIVIFKLGLVYFTCFFCMQRMDFYSLLLNPPNLCHQKRKG